MKRLQNRIAESRWALPVTAVYTLALWLTQGTEGYMPYLKLGIFALSAYLMVELNNRNALIRVYSRMVSCSFLVLTTMALPMLASTEVIAVQTCFVAAYLILFGCYQDKYSQGRMFYAFMFIGCASISFVQALFFIPVFWILIATNLMAFSGRNFWASVIGLTVPYWFIAGYCAITGNIDYFATHFAPEVWVTPFTQYNLPGIDKTVTIAFIILIGIIGIVHFMRNSYMDKIRTRMIYELIIVMTVATTAFIALQPQHAGPLTGILTINVSILIAHFIALTKTRLTNITFIVLALIAVGITVANLALNR